MTEKELIKQEIERRYNCEKCYPLDREASVAAAVLQELLLFIDSLTEEHNEDLEEYYKKEFLPNEWFAKLGQRTISEFNFFTAKHFAEWQKAQDEKIVFYENKQSKSWQRIYKKAYDDVKKEMMKDAVNATVYEGLFNKYVKEQDEGALSKVLANFEEGDKVRIIIVKED